MVRKNCRRHSNNFNTFAQADSSRAPKLPGKNGSWASTARLARAAAPPGSPTSPGRTGRCATGPPPAGLDASIVPPSDRASPARTAHNAGSSKTENPRTGCGFGKPPPVASAPRPPSRHLRARLAAGSVRGPCRAGRNPRREGYTQSTHPHPVTQNTHAHLGPLQVVRLITGA